MDANDLLINEQVLSFYKSIEKRMSPDDMARIKDAFQFAAEAHKKDFRKDGKPYITHPIEVASIIGVELELGCNSIIAALLHDVIEDTPVEIDEVEKRYGEDVAFLVNVVTKKKKKNYEMSKQMDNFKQVLDSVEYDIRAILIKLADRLHNMRTLSSLNENKQMKIAGETDYFYAPLANKLGLYNIKTELQNLSLKFRCPNDYEELNRLLIEEEKAYKSRLKVFTDKIEAILKKNNIEAEVDVKYRTPYSLWFRMKKLGKDFKQVDNKRTVWIIFKNDQQVSEKDKTLKIYSLLTDEFEDLPKSISNYIDKPKENGYQGFHIKLFNEQSGWEDIHISSERMIRNSRLGCIAERTDSTIANWIDKLKAVLKEISAQLNEGSFIENVVSYFYNDDIRVFSPIGQGIILPQGATALDFAYTIHSELGEHAQYARINGKLCSVKTVLKRGDCVEIGRNENIIPNPDWINHVKTYKAKKDIQLRLNKIKKISYNRCPVCLPLPEEEVIGFKMGDQKIMIHKRNCGKAISLTSNMGHLIDNVTFNEDKDIFYPVSIHIRAIDRFHLLHDMIDCITQKKLSISGLKTETIDEIVECRIHFFVHSAKELQDIITAIKTLNNVEEVSRTTLPL